MAFKLQDFRSAVRDLARQYRFEVEIMFPSVVGQSELVNLLVHSSKFPGRTVTPADGTFFMGQPYKVAGTLSYPDWQCSFRVDDNWDAWKRLKAWQETIHGTETNIHSFPNAYKSNINLYQLDVAGNRLAVITLNGAWPVDVGDISLDTTSREPLDQANVTFKYDFNIWKVL